MSWGVNKGIEETLQRLRDNDPSLTSLHIFQGKEFGSKEAAELAEALPGNTHLTELYASGHELDSASVRIIASAVGANQTLRTLCLGNSSFGDEGTAQLAEGIAGSSSLQQLDLESKGLGAEGAAALSRVLHGGLELTTLLLARNPLGNTGIAELANGVSGSRLTHLDVRDCGITAEGMHSLAEAVASSSSLVVLKLDENNLGTEGAEALANALSRNTTLEELHVSNTSIGDGGLAALVRASASSKLQILEANGCGISPEGAHLLRESLPASPILTLKLRDNSIGDEGAESIGKACASGAALQDLNLGNNQLGVGASRVLQSGTLKNVNLDNSELGDEGVMLLATMLTAKLQTNLQELELSGCGIGDAGLKRLFQVLQGFAAPALEVLLLAGNPGVNGPGFAMNVDVLSATRTDLDIVWRGNCEAPPTAVDGGPPKDLATATQNWSDTPEGETGQLMMIP